MNKPRSKQHVRFDEGTSPRFMSRCTDASENPIMSATIGSITYTVFTITSGVGQAVIKAGPSTLTIADVWHDTLQTDPGWQSDTVGYNFGAHLPASCFTTTELKAQTYQIEIRATPLSGDPFWVGIWVADVDACLSLSGA